ncbi:Mediator of RNA polymerase II transcription protein [Pyrenophora tritici-repentis]|nr:Mediator of RNA polymerase II transcription protein [Pyrenophora tritici-repentis]KAG9379592.1 Mediator of RNA polymerase II transcription protein [Pyrenophora tritici-repentis]KAI1552057.1 mediator of RNA polymerase II transcription subunit 17 [Pyrenophora tritici-repentis]KAI1587159.1 mediator of RNA polymerase II transcription subunit 17 [Pyrenophora tritici-repentis]KAI1591675.1 mediator of RNA polymerase II transcription subunit 17 [Pyrenophora tritici-repentis]
MEMYSHLEWAKFAANNALDLVSLILSQDPNKRSLNFFSPTFQEQGLKQGIPLGSFGVSKENHEHRVRKPEEQHRLQDLEARQEAVAQGARMGALDSSVDEILKAAKNLEKQIRRETKYWHEIVTVSDKGWPIQRLRQNVRHAPFGVRYGLPEASDHFKARGFAPLQMDKDGSIILDPALALKPKILRVRVSIDGNITGTTQLSAADDLANQSLEKSIQLARDSLLEEELYYEMSLETRQLLAYGVEFRDSVIYVDAPQMGGVSHERKLLIDCIPRDDPVPSSRSHEHDWMARNIAEGLRLLLAHEHSMRLYRRSQLPPPLTTRKREKPSPSLLRTLLAVIHHIEAVDSLYVYLESLARTLNSVGLDVTLDTTRETSWATLVESLGTPSMKGQSATDQLFEVFMKPFDGKATMSLPVSTGAQHESLSITTRTIIGQPTFGTEHKLILPPTLGIDLGLSQQQKFAAVEEITSYVDWILSLHLTHRLLQNEYSSRAQALSQDARLSIKGKDRKKGVKSSKDIEIELNNGELKASVLIVDTVQDIEEVEQSRTWSGKDGNNSSLREVIKSWVD